MPLTPLAVDHVALPIFAAAETLRFYTELLELPLLAAHSGDDWGGRPWLMMLFGLNEGRTLALTALAHAARPCFELPNDVRHLAFRVGSRAELSAWQDKLTQHGVRTSQEEHGDQQSLYFEDPNGYVLELTTPPGSAAPSGLDAHARIARWIAKHAPNTD